MINNYVTNLQPLSAVFDTVTTSATAGTYTQLNNHPNVDAVAFTMPSSASPVAVLVAYSSTPGTAQFLACTPTAGYVVVPTGPTKNSNALFATNASGSSAMTVTYMCLTYDNNKNYPTNRGTAG